MYQYFTLRFMYLVVTLGWWMDRGVWWTNFCNSKRSWPWSTFISAKASLHSFQVFFGSKGTAKILTCSNTLTLIKLQNSLVLVFLSARVSIFQIEILVTTSFFFQLIIWWNQHESHWIMWTLFFFIKSHISKKKNRIGKKIKDKSKNCFEQGKRKEDNNRIMWPEFFLG